MNETKYKWDLFLSHASEDKEEFVRPLANKLKENNIKVWYDEFEIDWGDSIRESIDNGLKESRFAIVILSINYFKKSWTNNELNAYFSIDSKEAKRILPVWYNVTYDEVKEYSPILVDRAAAKSEDGVNVIINKVKKRLKINFEETSKENKTKEELFKEEISWNSITQYTKHKFGILGISEYWQAALIDDLRENSKIKSIKDVDDSVEKAIIAVAAYVRERPDMFQTGTDFITKSIGFVNEEFRNIHNLSVSTLEAFKKYNSLLKN